MKIAITVCRMRDGSSRAACPSLPGCVAYGPSGEEATRRFEKVLRGYLASLDVPEAAQVEVSAVQDYAGGRELVSRTG